METDSRKTAVTIAIATPLNKVVKAKPAAKRATKPKAPPKKPVAKPAAAEVPRPNYELTADLCKVLAATNLKTPLWNFDGQLRFAKCVKVYDGDTAHFTFVPAPGLPPARFIIRMNGYNSAEMRGGDAAEKAAAVAARDFLADLIKGKIVLLSLGKSDKYGRYLADVFIVNDIVAAVSARKKSKAGGADDAPPAAVDPASVKGTASNHVNLIMLGAGHGKPYDGKGKKDW